MRILYSLIYTLAFLVILPYFLIAGLIRRKYFTSAPQRFGFIPQRSAEPSIWIHTVSVGEFLAAKPLIRKIQEKYPNIPLFISTTTITGQKLAAELLPDRTFYFPFDWRWCVRRIFQSINPCLILIFETEIWPNFLWEAHDQKIPVILINGRISDRSFSRYRFARKLIPGFTECWMQSIEDASRMKQIEKDPKRIRVMGNIKFEYQPQTLSPSLGRLIENWKRTSLLLIAGSTMPGEEEILLDSFKTLRSDLQLKMLIAPRHPERFNEVVELIQQMGLEVNRRSENESADTPIMILDTIGELAAVYEIGDLVFIGGTLRYHGHNPIEPAYYGKAIVSGPEYKNFRAVFEEFLSNHAIIVTEDITSTIRDLANDSERRKALGNSARELVQKNQGAIGFVLQNLRKYLDDRSIMEPGTKSSVR
ncbi:MAG TPA: 3-deoxy-D-manno-octulosonic acid transferase [Acidobacteriota bacterium]